MSSSRPTEPAPTGPAAEHDPIARIVTAARACFRERGVAKTRMGEIAERAGMARQTLYDFVANKTEIVDLALADRVSELAIAVRAEESAAPAGDLPERLVEVLARAVEVSRDDPEFVSLAGGLDERHAFQYIAGPSRLTELLTEIAGDLVEAGRAHGIVRGDVTSRAIIAWLQGMLASLVARDDLSAAELRETLRAFALPAVLT